MADGYHYVESHGKHTSSGLWSPESHEVNTDAIRGEPGTGFERHKGLGPFNCGNCKYYDQAGRSCGQKDMMEKSHEPRLSNGRVRVNPLDCCEYVWRVGRIR